MACANMKFKLEELQEAGVDTVFNIYTEAGAGFAGHVLAQRAAEHTSRPDSAESSTP